MEGISIGFSFFVISVAILVLFLDEITSSSKKLWQNQLLRNGGLMFLIAFFAFAYRVHVKALFLHLHANSIEVAKGFMPYIFYFQNQALVAFGFTYILLTISVVAVFSCLHFIFYRKWSPHLASMLWGSWIFIGAVYLLR